MSSGTSTPYIGSKISLISKLDIRYEGILYTVDSKESTIALSKVRSFGTEDRNASHVVPPQDEVYDYIIFKANDIKDLIVCETPKPAAPGLPYDPAILSVSQPPEKPTPAPVGTDRPVSANDTRSSTPRNNHPHSQQNYQGWQGNDNRPNNSTYRQGNYQNRNNQTRQQHGYDNNRYDYNKHQNRNFQNQSRNNYNNSNNRGGSRIQTRGGGSRPYGPRNNLKFDSDYDFEKAYEQFKETLESIVGDVKNCTIEDNAPDSDAGSVKAGQENEVFYDKKKSFFDNISCEALEKEEGKNTRPDWRKERLTNQETFGQQSVRSYGYRRGGRGFNYSNNRGGSRFQPRGGRPYGPHNNKP